MISVSQCATIDARNQAEAAAKERLLNAYLREVAIRLPSVLINQPCLSDVPEQLTERLQARGILLQLELPHTGALILGVITYLSPAGHHQFGHEFWAGRVGGDRYQPIVKTMQLAELLVDEVAAREPDPAIREARRLRLLAQIADSVERTALFVQAALQRGEPRLGSGESDDFLAAEQAIILGHPFHPSPKSAEGFSGEDLQRYAPELRASFPLHYFAADRDLVREAFLPGRQDNVIPAGVRAEAHARLGSARVNWALLPAHPWQADWLRQSPEVDSLMTEGRLIHLGPLGRPVHPTASVRTVWDPEHAYFFKLPLDVRVTNFVRNNPLDQLQRSLDASRVVASVQLSLPFERFGILLEDGYRTIRASHPAPRDAETLAASFGVIFRRFPAGFEDSSPMLLAALLEPSPRDGEPPLIRAIRRAANRQGSTSLAAFVVQWFRGYLEISLLPLLWLFIHHGISLEAHVQNSLLVLGSEWPEHFSIRDLEGASISQAHPADRCPRGELLPENSPALYSEEEAWHRLKYYFFVNHLGHLIFTLARYAAGDEALLWRQVGVFLKNNVALFNTRVGQRCLEDLLGSPELPAKANLTSCLLGRGERPLYVPMPNPLHGKDATS